MSTRRSGPRPSKKGKRRPRTVDNRIATNLRRFGQLGNPTRTFTRVMAYNDLTMTTSAGGVLAATTMVASSTVTSCADWSSCVNLYMSYRVRSIKVMWFPVFTVPCYNGGATPITVPSMIYVCSYWDGVDPLTVAQIADQSLLRMGTGYTKGEYSCDALNLRLDLDAHSWTSTSASIPAAEVFGIKAIGTSFASTINTTFWKYNVWFEVEFKIAG